MTPHDYTKTELHSQPFGATITVKRRVELVRAASVSPMAASTCATSRKERERESCPAPVDRPGARAIQIAKINRALQLSCSRLDQRRLRQCNREQKGTTPSLTSGGFMVKVYNFTKGDPLAGENVRVLAKFTADAIKRLNAEAVLETEEEVDERYVDADGKYSPPLVSPPET